LKIEKRKLEENRYLMGGGSERAIALIGEARRVGLIDPAMQIDYQDYQEMYLTLQKAMNWVPNQVQPSNGMDRLTFLQSKLQECQTDYDELGINIDNAKRFIGESTGYSSEAEHQKVRLES